MLWCFNSIHDNNYGILVWFPATWVQSRPMCPGTPTKTHRWQQKSNYQLQQPRVEIQNLYKWYSTCEGYTTSLCVCYSHLVQPPTSGTSIHELFYRLYFQEFLSLEASRKLALYCIKWCPTACLLPPIFWFLSATCVVK
jgi:hypothetical protein